jgi:hypothetical protein
MTREGLACDCLCHLCLAHVNPNPEWRGKALDKWGTEKKSFGNALRAYDRVPPPRWTRTRADAPVCRLRFFPTSINGTLTSRTGQVGEVRNPWSSTSKFPGSRTPRAQCCHVAIDQTSLISHTKGSLRLRIMPSASGQRRCREVARRRS